MTMKKKRLVAGAVGAVVIGATTVFGSSGAFAVPQGDQNAATTAVSDGTNGAAVAADAVAAFANSTLSGVFGGVSLTNSGNSLVVHLTSITPAVTSSIDAITSAAGIVPTFVSAPATLTQLNAKLDAITAASSVLSANGITLESWTIDGQSGLIDVNVLNGTAAQDATVAAEFGSLVQVANVSRLPIAAADRGTDYSPFDGGAGKPTTAPGTAAPACQWSQQAGTSC